MPNFCSNCGQAVAPEASFCSNCGHRLEDSAPAEPEQPAPPPTPPKPEPEKTQGIDDALGSVGAWFKREIVDVQPPKYEPRAQRPAPAEPEQPESPRAEQPAAPPPAPPVERSGGRGAMKVLKGCGIAAGVVVGLFIVLMILAAIFGEPRDEDDTDAPATPERQEQVSETEPTSTPVPTPERVSESEPTATPKPTATPIPLCKREAESIYIVALADFMDVIGTSSVSLGERFTELGQNPALLFTSEWRDGVTLSMGIMLFAATSIIELEAPDSLDEIDKVAKRMARQIEDALGLYASAIDDIDPDKLEQANQIILQSTQLVFETGDIASRVCGG